MIYDCDSCGQNPCVCCLLERIRDLEKRCDELEKPKKCPSCKAEIYRRDEWCARCALKDYDKCMKESDELLRRING